MCVILPRGLVFVFSGLTEDHLVSVFLYLAEVERSLFAETLFEVCVVPGDAVGREVIFDGGFEVFAGGEPFFVAVADCNGIKYPIVGVEVVKLREVFK